MDTWSSLTPHSGATYKITARKDGAFEVEVSLPDASPVIMTNFTKQADAERWIDQQKASVNVARPLRRSFKIPEMDNGNQDRLPHRLPP